MLNSYAELGKRITPVLLTFNEAPNLARTLASLAWAERVVIVDSGSTDETKAIAEGFSNVNWKYRAFDTHAQQWNFAIRSAEITSDYVLALDADMTIRREFLDEAIQDFLPSNCSAAIVPFRYVVGGVVLHGSLYPAQARLFRRDSISVQQCGHTQVFQPAAAPLYRFKEFLLHDDRKPFDRWLRSQLKYAELESARLNSSSRLSLKDRLRRYGLMPLIAALTGYFRSGGLFAGKAAVRYAQERMLYECVLGIQLTRSGSDS
jgi:glycosyltransferase involved in cell wall biosynthesis